MFGPSQCNVAQKPILQHRCARWESKKGARLRWCPTDGLLWRFLSYLCKGLFSCWGYWSPPHCAGTAGSAQGWVQVMPHHGSPAVCLLTPTWSGQVGHQPSWPEQFSISCFTADWLPLIFQLQGNDLAFFFLRPIKGATCFSTGRLGNAFAPFAPLLQPSKLNDHLAPAQLNTKWLKKICQKGRGKKSHLWLVSVCTEKLLCLWFLLCPQQLSVQVPSTVCNEKQSLWLKTLEVSRHLFSSLETPAENQLLCFLPSS